MGDSPPTQRIGTLRSPSVTTRYVVRRPPWRAIGMALLVRLVLALALAVVGSVLITEGIRPW